MLRAFPDPIPSRERFLAIVAEHGYPRSIADWLAMNVRLGEGGLHFRLDLDAIEALLADYFERRSLAVLEAARPRPRSSTSSSEAAPPRSTPPIARASPPSRGSTPTSSKARATGSTSTPRTPSSR
jgi:hypothetical protein